MPDRPSEKDSPREISFRMVDDLQKVLADARAALPPFRDCCCPEFAYLCDACADRNLALNKLRSILRATEGRDDGN